MKSPVQICIVFVIFVFFVLFKNENSYGNYGCICDFVIFYEFLYFFKKRRSGHLRRGGGSFSEKNGGVRDRTPICKKTRPYDICGYGSYNKIN